MPAEDVITRVAQENPVAPARAAAGADDGAAARVRQMVHARASGEPAPRVTARRSRLTVLAALVPAAVVVALVAVVMQAGHHAHQPPPAHRSPAPAVAHANA